jgi:hypothetical protein
LVNNRYDGYDDQDLITLAHRRNGDELDLRQEHHPVVHLLFALVDIIFLVLVCALFQLPTFIRDVMVFCFSVAFVVNMAWCIVGFIDQFISFYRWTMRYLPWLTGMALMIWFHLLLAPMMKMTHQMWTPASAQCPEPDHYRYISQVTDRWYDFMLEHVGVCTACSFPINSSLCAEFCDASPVSVLGSNPALRMIGDVVPTHGFTFLAVICMVVFAAPLVIRGGISNMIPRLKRVPIGGATIAAKWAHLMKQVTSPWITLISPYRADQSHWLIWRYYMRVILTFASGARTRTTFAIVSSLVHAGLFATTLVMKPHLCFVNYAYDLLVTFLCFIFPIIYAVLPPNPAYASAFPSAALAIGVVYIIGSLIYEFYPKRQAACVEWSDPDPRKSDASTRF